MGRGLFATEDIKVNTKIHEAYFIKTKDKEVDLCPDIAKYVFGYSKTYSVLCLGLGSLFNHSDTPSVQAYFDKNENGEIMEFWTTRDVVAGEELFISYGGDEYAFSHLLKKEKKKIDLESLVYNFKTKNKKGFTYADQKKLLKKFPKINMQKYNSAMMGQTCIMINKELVTYHHDVLKALRCGLENRNLTEIEFD